MKTQTTPRGGVPESFIAQQGQHVIGQLHGFDRLRLQGTLPPLYNPEIMAQHLWETQTLHKDFKAYAEGITQRMRAGIEQAALCRQRPVVYLRSCTEAKEERARTIAAEEGITSGVICVLSCVEAGLTYEACPERATRKLELRLRPKRSLHLYVYLFHALLGFMHVRFQIWFPFLVQMCVNGREWLAQQMTRAGLGFTRERNCFSWLEDTAAAQALMDEQLRTDWPALCNGLVEELNPVAAEVRAPLGLAYYWTTPETEYAHDVMFEDRAALEAVYPRLVQHGITSFGCEQVLRFLHRGSHLTENSEVKSHLGRRPEGVRLKHWAQANSVKMYDKGSVLRVEVTINNPKAFRIVRAPTGQPDAPKKARVLRRTTADLYGRARLSQAATERYFAALSATHAVEPLGTAVAGLCRRVRWKKQTFRALNPLAASDAALLVAINNAKFTIGGLTNADLREMLYDQAKDPRVRRRQAARITRLIRLLRAHKLLVKVPNVHRYHVPPKARRLLTALQAARQADVEKLTQLAA
jgi:hypothetical protein